MSGSTLSHVTSINKIQHNDNFRLIVSTPVMSIIAQSVLQTIVKLLGTTL